MKRQAGDIEDCVRADGCPVDVTQWQSTGSSSYVSWVECLATDDLLTSLQNVYAHTPMYCSLFSCKWQQLAVGSLTDEILLLSQQLFCKCWVSWDNRKLPSHHTSTLVWSNAALGHLVARVSREYCDLWGQEGSRSQSSRPRSKRVWQVQLPVNTTHTQECPQTNFHL